MATFIPQIERVEVFQEEGTVPITWRGEAYDDDGGVHMTTFSGDDAKDRALDHAMWRYMHQYNGEPRGLS